MFDPLSSSWNIRDSYFFETLWKTREHLLSTRGDDRVVVWAHNSHLGDARYTHLESKAPEKELNVGQLIRETYEVEVITVGQLTYNGSMTCADNWNEPHQMKTIRNAFPNSYEELLHMVSKKV
jgi:erythromycin esterase-like protein